MSREAFGERKSQKTRDIPHEFIRLVSILCIVKRVTRHGVNSHTDRISWGHETYRTVDNLP